MSNPTVVPRPLECVFLDAGTTLLSPWPRFQVRRVAVAAQHGVSFEQGEAEGAIMAADREAIWPTDWTDPATQREFWYGFYTQVLERLGHDGDRQELAGALYRTFSDPASYRLFEASRSAVEARVARGLKL